MYCNTCKRFHAQADKCNEVAAFRVWLDKHLESAVEAFGQSDLFKFELYYHQWQNTHK